MIIRLRRVGSLNNPHYRIVAADERSPRDGRFVEVLGSYHPSGETPEEKVTLNTERTAYWIGVGAQISAAVRPLLKLKGVALPVRRKVSRKSAPAAQPAETAQTAPAPPATAV